MLERRNSSTVFRDMLRTLFAFAAVHVYTEAFRPTGFRFLHSPVWPPTASIRNAPIKRFSAQRTMDMVQLQGAGGTEKGKKEIFATCQDPQGYLKLGHHPFVSNITGTCVSLLKTRVGQLHVMVAVFKNRAVSDLGCGQVEQL